MTSTPNLCAWLLLLMALPASAQADPQPRLDRVDPPHWWVGMQHERVQLMLHGSGIARTTPELARTDVRIDAVTRTPNPNYLFIDLRIAPDATADTVEITLRGSGSPLALRYGLRARAPGSAARRGFSSADVVLNLMPDRFANGSPANDQVPGFTDPLNRGSEGGRHGGDIQGIIQGLGHIAAMGYTAIWPTPLTQSNQPSFSYHGYGTTDAYRIDPRYGSHADYLRMVTLAREKGLCVIQDVVPNHIGSQHWWTHDLPAPDWLSDGNGAVLTSHARTTASDPYAVAADKLRFTAGWFDKTLPDLNPRNPQVATYLTQNAIWWIEEAGLCGLRVDTYAYSDRDFINAWTRRILDEYPQLNIVGEEWSDNPVVQAYWLRGRTQADGFRSHLPSVMDYVLHGALRKALLEPDSPNGGLQRLYDAMVNDRLYAEPGNMMLFDGNHDTPRLASALDDDPALIRMALAYVLTTKRVPQLYYGTEIGMTSPKRHDAFDAFRADFPGGWEGDTVNAFSGAGLKPEQAALQAWLRKLLNWRKTQPAVHHGALTHYVPEDGTYVYFRHDAKDTVMVVFNKATEARTLRTGRFAEVLAGGALPRAGTDVLTGQRLVLGDAFTVPPRSVLVVQLDRPSAPNKDR